MNPQKDIIESLPNGSARAGPGERWALGTSQAKTRGAKDRWVIRWVVVVHTESEWFAMVTSYEKQFT